MIFKIKIADNFIEIDSLYNDIYNYCIDYISEEQTTDFTVKTFPEDIAFEKEKALIINEEAKDYSDGFFETNAVFRKIATWFINHDVCLMHGSAIALNGDAYLFIAPSGTGKTTHTKLWMKKFKDCYVVNGDKPFLKVKEKILVYGTPWCGKERMQTNTAVPLKAIVLLERADENKITKISFKEAFSALIAQSYCGEDKAHLIATVALLQKIGQKVAFYRLECNMNEDAAIVAYNGMNNLPI